MKIPAKMPKWMIYTCFAALVAVLLALNVFLVMALTGTPAAPQTNSLSPAASWTLCAISLLLSLLLLAGVFLLMRMAVAAGYSTVSNEMLGVADWVFRNVLRRQPNTQTTDTETIQKDIEDWYYERQRDVDEQVDARTEEWTKELKMATDFQLAMMERPYPEIPEIHITDRLRLNFYHKYQAASGLGGDFFDIIKVDRDVGGVFIADVMGHGTRSALITSILRTLMTDAMQVGRNAPHFLGQVNQGFCEILKTIPDLVFASAFYFVGDTTSRMATFSAAGHPPPLHIRRSVNRVEYLDVPPPRAAALGILPDEEFPGGNIRLVPEDVFIFYTDGVMEAFNPDGDEFGEERAKRVVERYMYQDIPTIVNNLYNAVLQWADGRPMADDVCIIAVEATTKPPAKEEKK
jgi:serine phosphatase RsbU (regulator of sigma subunit)